MACNLPVAEYAPLTIKSAVVGYGLAAKEQVQFMVARLLDLAASVLDRHGAAHPELAAMNQHSQSLPLAFMRC